MSAELECFDWSTNIDGRPYPEDRYCGGPVLITSKYDAECLRCGCSWSVASLKQWARSDKTIYGRRPIGLVR